MASDCNYGFFRISKTEGLEESAAKYRELRLRGLQASPSSFSSTYEIEAAFTTTDWIERLSTPDRENFICVAKAPNTTPSGEGEWIGQVTLRGPLSTVEFSLTNESGHLLGEPDAEERWQLLSLFILPEHRGAGLGGTLCRKALNHLQSYRLCQLSPDKVHVRLMLKADNQAVAKLYEHIGFMHSGKCTLAEALLANGDGHLMPSDASSAKYSTRTGLIMSIYIQRP